MKRPDTPAKALKRLKDGNARYVKDEGKGENRGQDTRNDNLNGQKPWCVILSCADSRVAPELVFDTGIGELFVIRVAGNIANTSSMASIEYAVAHIDSVKLVVVLGHEECGAVIAAKAGGDNGYNLNHLVSHLVPACEAVGKPKGKDSKAHTKKVVLKNADLQAKELEARSSIIGDAVKKRKIKVITGYYNLKGAVDFN